VLAPLQGWRTANFWSIVSAGVAAASVRF